MSELTQNIENRVSARWQLMATASAIALIGSAYSIGLAHADSGDSDRPQFWMELGGQLDRLEAGQEFFSPPLMDGRSSMFSPSEVVEKPSLYSIGESGKISFQPHASDWTFSASVQFGRTSNKRNVQQRTHPGPAYKYYVSPPGRTPSGAHVQPVAAKFATTTVRATDSHLVVDFQAGKDVGLGMFGGRNGSSFLSLGVRFAQFGASSNISLKSDPDEHFVFKYTFGIKIPHEVYHSNAAGLQASRSFHGVGPSISWNASAPFAGNADRGEIAVNWGVNAAVLFGRQKAFVHHQTTSLYHSKSAAAAGRTVVTHYGTTHERTHSVTVPNVGGFAGLSFRYSNAKISAGYRADLFFGAMDGGIDTAKKENVGFYGPFASVNVGIGG